jgi:myosin heavy subunit
MMGGLGGKLSAMKSSLSNPGLGSPKWSPGKPALVSSPSISKSTPQAMMALPDKIDEALRVLRFLSCRPSEAGPRTSRASVVLNLQFRDDGVMVGARVNSELLDRSCLSQGLTRVPGRAFDALHAVMHSAPKYGAQLEPLGDYRYLGKRGSAKDVSADKKIWEDFADALLKLKISTYEISYLVQLMAAVIHLGNLDFLQPDEDYPPTPADPALFKTICSLLCLDEKLLISVLYNLPDDRTYQPTNRAAINTLDEIYVNTDFFAQTIYGMVYDWVVLQLNAFLSNEDRCSKVITLVDLPGMISEPTYGALCSNLLCELLHDHCISQLVEAKLIEFREEEIEIPNITVPNRQETVDVILALLYFVAEVPNCSNETMVTCLANLQSSQTTEVIIDYDDTACTLRHSGGIVSYSYQCLRDAAGMCVSDQWVGSMRQTGNLILRQVSTQQFTTLMEREALFLQSLREGVDGASMPNEQKGIDVVKAKVTMPPRHLVIS